MIELTLETAGAPAFAGPLDLLLAIVRRNGYPLDRLPLAEITRQFTAYVQQSNEHMLELGSDFCETVSWLVLLKSRMLLPGHSEGREVAPEDEQVQALSGLLEERLAMVGLGAGLDAGHAGRLKQQAVLETQRGEDAPRTTPTVQDALASARRAMASARAYAEAHVAAEPSLSLDEVLGRLQARVAALAPGQTVSPIVCLCSHCWNSRGAAGSGSTSPHLWRRSGYSGRLRQARRTRQSTNDTLEKQQSDRAPPNAESSQECHHESTAAAMAAALPLRAREDPRSRPLRYLLHVTASGPRLLRWPARKNTHPRWSSLPRLRSRRPREAHACRAPSKAWSLDTCLAHYPLSGLPCQGEPHLRAPERLAGAAAPALARAASARA
jgi:chromatin segregation and condensation protein Rec8/ScpA/Scc1 (kleisin family)